MMQMCVLGHGRWLYLAGICDSLFGEVCMRTFRSLGKIKDFAFWKPKSQRLRKALIITMIVRRLFLASKLNAGRFFLSSTLKSLIKFRTLTPWPELRRTSLARQSNVFPV